MQVKLICCKKLIWEVVFISGFILECHTKKYSYLKDWIYNEIFKSNPGTIIKYWYYDLCKQHCERKQKIKQITIG